MESKGFADDYRKQSMKFGEKFEIIRWEEEWLSIPPTNPQNLNA